MLREKNRPKVTLVGAGPGDAELITLKGLRAIQNADCILYDALVNVDLLSYANKNVPKIYVGKRYKKHKYSQENINQLLVDSAYKYGNVVRLKGGDSFVFGRGSEEIDYVESFGLPTEVVPGISSALSVPALQGIPVTKRGVSDSFMVVTATKSDGEISNDLIYGAQSSATLVILMGLRKINSILETLRIYKDNDTPFAIIQNGSLNGERVYLGKLGDERDIKIDYSKPGIVVVGEVVENHPEYLEDKIQRVLASY